MHASRFVFSFAISLMVAVCVGGSSYVPDSEVVAVRLQNPLVSDGMPSPQDWERAQPVSFDRDWQGKNDEPDRQTEVRLLWSPDAIYVRFRCLYRTIHVFDDSEPNGRRDQLWERDVAEVFLQPSNLGGRHYKEFEVSPNGQWIDLTIAPEGGEPLNSGLRRVVSLNETRKQWIAVLAIPMKSLTEHFDLATSWRVNFYRCEGANPRRAYLAWRPTYSSRPNFHVPESFGKLRFAE